MTKTTEFHICIALLVAMISIATILNWQRIPHLYEIELQYDHQHTYIEPVDHNLIDTGYGHSYGHYREYDLTGHCY
jgi:hypothetical protein